MLESYKIGVCCIKTRNMVSLYNELDKLLLVDERDSKKIDELMFKIKNNLKSELDSYANLSKQNLIQFQIEMQELSLRDDVSSECIFRIKNKLTTFFDKICKNTLVNKDLFSNLDPTLKFSILDLVNSKIAIDTQKLVFNKINSLYDDTNKMENYILLLKDIDKIYAVSYLSLHEVSERLAIDCLFDVNKITTFSFSDIEKRINDEKGVCINLVDVYNDLFFSAAISLLEVINSEKFDANNILSIYTHLGYVSKLEILTNYLTKNQLLKLEDYCKKLKINMILKNDISNNIKKKILEK